MNNGDASPKINELKERLAESVRICVREELLENFGHVSARDPESKRIFVLRAFARTPRQSDGTRLY